MNFADVFTYSRILSRYHGAFLLGTDSFYEDN